MSLIIRPARPGDAGAVIGFIRKLAEYEGLLDEVEANEAQLKAALFSPNPRVFADIAEWNGVPAGFTLWFYNFSTFRGRHGIYLEDIFVEPGLRGRGIGKALLAGLAKRCLDEGLGRLEWWVLDWNEATIDFYRALGARAMDDWTVFRLTGEALEQLGSDKEDEGGLI